LAANGAAFSAEAAAEERRECGRRGWVGKGKRGEADEAVVDVLRRTCF
jgi:hypothetical protein